MYQRKYYVVFKTAEKKKWYNFLLHKKFSHCALLTSGWRGSIEINPSEGGIGLYTRQNSVEDLVAIAQAQGLIVCEYMAREEQINQAYKKFFRSCVGICKDFLGIRKWWIVTPYQLYKEVKKHEQPI